MPEWLSPQIVKEAHGKLTAWAKPQAFSIISADFSFLGPIQESDYHRRYFLSLSLAFWAFLAVAALCS